MLAARCLMLEAFVNYPFWRATICRSLWLDARRASRGSRS